jgi:hypothetical protein
MFDRKKIISVMPSGRLRYMEIALPYILDQQGLIDEHHFWVNTCDSEDINPLSPPSAPVQGRLQSPPAKSKFLAVKALPCGVAETTPFYGPQKDALR